MSLVLEVLVARQEVLVSLVREEVMRPALELLVVWQVMFFSILKVRQQVSVFLVKKEVPLRQRTRKRRRRRGTDYPVAESIHG